MMKTPALFIALLLLAWQAGAQNLNAAAGVQPLNQDSVQQQRMLDNQQREQRRLQQQRQFDANQQRLQQTSPGNSRLIPNNNQPRSPFDRSAPSVPQAPLPAAPAG
ncbi:MULTISPECIES: hypothetical protein [Gibbsiella]|nr:hypothetical protein [Gibbsiella quercinecans]